MVLYFFKFSPLPCILVYFICNMVELIQTHRNYYEILKWATGNAHDQLILRYQRLCYRDLYTIKHSNKIHMGSNY